MLLSSVLSWRVSQARDPCQIQLSPGTWSLWPRDSVLLIFLLMLLVLSSTWSSRHWSPCRRLWRLFQDAQLNLPVLLHLLLSHQCHQQSGGWRLFCLQYWQCLHDLLMRLPWSFPEICWRGWVRVDTPIWLQLLFGTSLLCCGQILWTCMGRDKMLPPSMSLLVLSEIAGVNKASLGRYLHSSKTGAGCVEGFHDELNSPIFNLERESLSWIWLLNLIWIKTRKASAQTTHIQAQNYKSMFWLLNTHYSHHTILDWSLPRLTRTVPSTEHQMDVLSMLLVHYQRFVEETTSPP